MRPAKADYCSGAAVGRSGDAFGDHEGESIEKPTVLLGFWKVAQNGGGWGGWGLQTVSQQLGCSFRHPAAAARSCGWVSCCRVVLFSCARGGVGVVLVVVVLVLLLVLLLLLVVSLVVVLGWGAVGGGARAIAAAVARAVGPRGLVVCSSTKSAEGGDTSCVVHYSFCCVFDTKTL